MNSSETFLSDLQSLRRDFRTHFVFNFCACSQACPWNKKVLPVLLHLWEVIQVTMMNLDFQPTRRILNLTDFRVPGKH